VGRDSGLILRVTRIESRVVSGYGLNGEHIDPLPDPREGYVVETIDGGVIQQPGDIHGQVTESSTFVGSSPKSKCVIFGGTLK